MKKLGLAISWRVARFRGFRFSAQGNYCFGSRLQPGRCDLRPAANLGCVRSCSCSDCLRPNFFLYLASLVWVWNTPNSQHAARAQLRNVLLFAVLFRLPLWWSQPIQEVDLLSLFVGRTCVEAGGESLPLQPRTGRGGEWRWTRDTGAGTLGDCVATFAGSSRDFLAYRAPQPADDLPAVE